MLLERKRIELTPALSRYLAAQKLESELARERYSWLTCNRITVKE